MSLHTTRTSSASYSFGTRPAMDPSQRLRTYGRLRPHESQRSWIDRLLGR